MLFETRLTAEMAEDLSAAGFWLNRTLCDCLEAAVERAAERTALVDGRSRLTYGELWRQAGHAALALLKLGVRRRDVVSVQLPNWNEFAVLAVAVELIGAVINPLAPILRERELRGMIRLARPSILVTSGRFRQWDYPAMYRELLGGDPNVRAVIVVGEGELRGEISWEALLAMGAESAALAPALSWTRSLPNDVYELMFTSGTTGEPKGVLHTPNTLAAAIDTSARIQGLNADDVFHMASTFGHQTGFLYGVLAPLRLGARAVYQDRWDANQFVELAEQEHVTFTMGATPFLADVARVPGLAERKGLALRLFACAGAPIPRPLARDFSQALPRCRLLPAWGMTENGMVTGVFPGDPADKVTGTDGRCYPGMEVIVRGEDNRPVPVGVQGELYARGPFTFVGYVQGNRFTEQFFDDDGWFATGDRAVVDQDGFIRITGRSKDVIIRGGENLPVKEIEDTLLRHPAVRSVAVVGLPHPRLGEIACACVVPEPETDFTLAEMRGFLEREKMTRQYWPERVELMDRFPMTPAGKVQKFRLREKLAQSDQKPSCKRS